jgi:DGQHR domain-containing protein
MKYPVIPFDQPAGSFLLTAMPVPEVIHISRADPRKFDNVSMETIGGIQREPSPKRIREIAEYANTVDATFPTPILLALDPDTYALDGNEITILREGAADIVDGQHRLLGLKESPKQQDFVIPVVFILDATEEQKAIIFATINGKQTKVPASLVYDLFGVTKTRSPQKTAHEIARAINSTSTSPWFRRLKMLGKKTYGSMESLSQGTFVKTLLPHISADPVTDLDRLKRGEKPLIHSNCVFNEYFHQEQDSTILKILMNLFQAARETWPQEWEDPSSYILTKTVGFTGIMKALPEIVRKGRQTGDLSLEFFRNMFEKVKKHMDETVIQLTSVHFPSSSAGASKFQNMIIEAI